MPKSTVLAVFGLLAPCGLAQRFSYGVAAGGSITNDFVPSFNALNPNIPAFESARRGFVIGPTVEYSFTKTLALEVSALNRTLHARGRGFLDDGSVFPETTFPVVTWQFPVLAKYTIPLDTGFRPFLEGGPSFRTAGNLNGQDPSDFGFTAGTGVEWRFARWAVAPTVRYTRWQCDPSTKPDQVEALISLRRLAARTDGHSDQD